MIVTHRIIYNECAVDNFQEMKVEKVEIVTARKALALCHVSATFVGMHYFTLPEQAPRNVHAYPIPFIPLSLSLLFHLNHLSPVPHHHFLNNLSFQILIIKLNIFLFI